MNSSMYYSNPCTCIFSVVSLLVNF
jgi:hypothetical protein